MKIKKGDTVKILYGKETGKQGVVRAVLPKKDAVVVEGLNYSKRHLKGDGRTRTSEILKIEKPFDISKVMLVCPLCGKSTRISLKKEENKVVRVCKKCGKDIAGVTDKITKKDSIKKTESKK